MITAIYFYLSQRGQRGKGTNNGHSQCKDKGVDRFDITTAQKGNKSAASAPQAESRLKTILLLNLGCAT